MNFSENKNVLILKDKTSLQILNEVCQEQNIPLAEFCKLIIWQAENKNSRLNGITKLLDEVLSAMK